MCPGSLLTKHLKIAFILTFSYSLIGKVNNYLNFSDENNRTLRVIYHPLYSMNNFVTNKSKLPQDGAQVFPYMG